MNNLKHLKIRCLPVDDIKGQIIHISLGDDKKRKEIYYLQNGSLNLIDLEKAEECTICTEIHDVIRAEYMPGHNKISISAKRNIFIIDCDTKEFYKRDFEEIHQTGWSSGFDNFAILFKSGELSTYLFDSRCELIDQATGNIRAPAPQQQSVGWGSQKTQFQGPSLPEEGSSNELHIIPTDNRTPVISWRGNGDEFVVTYVEHNVRVFKVFDNNCSPKAHSEGSKGLFYGPVAWKPQGNIIAAAMFHNGKNCLGLFERNGLFRMHFPLVDVLYPISSLLWSICGRVLIISQEDDKGNSHACLYTTCNMKWFLKQNLIFGKNNPLCTLTWVPTDPQCLELVAVTKNEVIEYKYKFQFDYDHNHNMIVAINGKSLRIHGFSKSVDPSPSCTSVTTLANPVNMIAFHPDKDLLVAIDSSNKIYCFAVNGIELTLSIQSSLGAQSFPLKVNHLFWKADSPHVLVENPSEGHSILYEFNEESKQLVKKQQFDVTQYPIEQIYAVDNIVVKHDAKFRNIHRVTETPVTSLNIAYPYEVLPLKYESEIFSLVLNPNQDLFIEDELVCRGITSMLVYKDYLLLTDNTTLYTLKLSRQSMDTLAVDGLSEFHSRPLNELEYLVCMMGDTSNIILHTPRGNLEIVACRSMQIRNIEELLCKGEWADVIRIMRLGRLDWNLLIDLDPERFYANISKVVAESDSQHTLNAIVAEVSDENCLTTVYKNTIEKIPYLSMNKKRRFLEKLSEYLDKSGSFVNYLPTVVKVCLDQNNVQKAMTYLSFLMKSTGKQHDKSEQAVAQMRMQVEAADLFQAALFTFDINLAEYVAEKCQMNPQEVGPLLDELKQMDNFERRIHIHLRYENWDTAVTYMLNRDQKDKEEILKFIREHDVAKAAYMEAIKIKELDFMEDIAQLYVEKLIQKRHHSEAAIILVKYLLFDDAIEQFKLALDYKKCIEYIPQSSLSEESKKQLFIELAEKLIVAQRVQDAAIIYETQLEDYTTAVKTLTEGGLFTDALRIAKERSLSNLIDILILPKMFSMVQKIRDIVEDTTIKFKKGLERLNRLRNDKKYLFEKSLKRSGLGGALLTESLAFRRKRTDGLEKQNDQEFDLQSLVSQRSSRSTSSSSTTVTQKQVRKMEKQKQDTTEGSKFEDIALMRELHIMITLIFKYGPEAKELFLRLIEYSIMDLTTLHQHHQKLYDLQILMQDEVHNIWDEEFRSGSTVNHINENYFFMDEQYRVIPPEIDNPGLTWALEIFKQ
ncbi:elongator complex protein 1 [Coccinella septempunctata]|uniref:elongator complex protein 1 n=1 Tax=Coccinella septempunctata TaxID=41139 RepID=UPI001D06258B|nr:elongator complex protein 1 [Coccinella septempunctata]XP_044764995.1 elongator complex protein 1 [Coccinella septempunctata]